MGISRITQPVAILVIVGLVFAVTIGVVFAASGSWYKNGSSMSGSHSTNWISPNDREMWSSSNAQTPRGVIEQIFADARLEDRCANSDGTWQTWWYQYGYGNSSASWAYSSGTAYARGTYQNCQYGHQYRNRSLHYFYDSGFGLNENYWLCSDTC